MRTLKMRLGGIWIQREEPQRSIGYRCYSQVHTIMTRIGFLGAKGVLADVTSYGAVSQYNCWLAAKNKMWKDQILAEISEGFWSTNHTIQVHYRWCCYDYKNTVENFFVEVGEVASIDGKIIMTDLQDLSACRAASGHCQDNTMGTTVWNGTVFSDQCDYHYHGTYTATLSGTVLLIPALQGAFSYSGKCHPPGSECVPETSFYIDQGATFIRFVC